MTSTELLNAVFGHRTAPEIAKVLGVTEADTLTQLRDAEKEGLVVMEDDESPSAPGVYWHLTDAGLERHERDAAHGPE